jgi:hypothetical protein
MSEALMVAERSWVTRDEVVSVLHVTEGFLLELERESIIETDPEGRYDAALLERIRICHTLHDELGVNFEGLEVALHLIDRINAERSQFREVLEWLRTQLHA